MAEGDTASALYGTSQTICLGYHVTDMGVFLGMILGVIVALVHNRFIDTEFKGAMAMYGNSKFVFIVLLPIVLVLALAAAISGLLQLQQSMPSQALWQALAHLEYSCMDF